MSSPYDSSSSFHPSSAGNPDKRLLPPGWIDLYDKHYDAWYYVNTGDPAHTRTWVHPEGPPPSSFAPQNYAPPPGPPPPDNRGYSPSPYPPQGGYNQGPPTQGWGSGYGGHQSGQWGYGNPQGGGAYAGGYGSPSPGSSGWQQGPPQGYYGAPSPQPQVVYVEQNKNHDKKKMGMGTVLAAGGAGLLGGFLLDEAIEHHDRKEYDEGFQNGFQDGFQDGDDFGNNDW